MFSKLSQLEGTLSVSTKEELLFLWAHLKILSFKVSNLQSIKHVEEIPSSVPGFGPSIQDVSEKVFINRDWNKDVSAMSCLYKYSPANTLIFHWLVMDGSVSVLSISDKSSSDISAAKSFSIEINPSQFINDSLLNSQLAQTGNISLSSRPQCIAMIETLFTNSEDFNNRLEQLFYQLVEKPQEINVDKNNSQNIFVPPSGVIPSFPSNPNYPNNPNINDTFIPSVGDRDINPFPNNPLLNPVNPLDPFYNPPNRSSGGLVGPDHELFNPRFNNGRNNNGNNNNFNYPGARFDPFYPEVPDLMGGGRGGSLDPFGGGRGGRGERGRNRGEPNSDHFSPPGFGNNFF